MASSQLLSLPRGLFLRSALGIFHSYNLLVLKHANGTIDEDWANIASSNEVTPNSSHCSE